MLCRGNTLEILQHKVGFSQVDITDGVLLVNGIPVTARAGYRTYPQEYSYTIYFRPFGK